MLPEMIVYLTAYQIYLSRLGNYMPSSCQLPIATTAIGFAIYHENSRLRSVSFLISMLRSTPHSLLHWKHLCRCAVSPRMNAQARNIPESQFLGIAWNDNTVIAIVELT